MKRELYDKLVEWKYSPERKPLLLYGARQVGKTYLLKEFGKNEFGSFVYINCEKNEIVKQLFAQDYDIGRIIEGLEILSGEEINPHETLLFFDEVQEIPNIVTALKYFCENAKEYCVAAAGSLLGVHDLQGNSFPVGKVDIMHLYPMTFIEFLCARGEEKKAQLLKSGGNEELINTLLPVFIGFLRQFYFVGGMPEAVKEFVSTQDIAKVREIQKNILSGYYADVVKHTGSEAQKCRLVFENIPSQLAKENKKFVYGAIKKGARAKEYETAIQWLVDAGLVYKVCRVTKPEIPLKFYIDKDTFKLFLLDIGLLGALLDTPAKEIMVGDKIFSEYKGAFTENYVLTQLITGRDLVIGYFSKPNSTLEIDFIVQFRGKIYPLEVKAEENVKSKSLNQFINIDHSNLTLHGYRTSMKGFRRQDWVSNIPLPAIESILHDIPV